MEYTVHSVSGIDVILAPMRDANSTTIEIIVKAGSVYETKQTNGISHFLEHMFFKGGKRYPTPSSVAIAVDSIGGEFNAYTGNEYAGYYVKSAPDSIHVGIDVLSDMLVHAHFPAPELEREKGVIIEEIKMYEDMPRSDVVHKRHEFYYGDNSYGWSTLGPIDNIKAFDRQHFFDHKNTLYTKDNLVIVIAGKIVDEAAILEQIGELFADLPSTATMTQPAYTRHTPPAHEGHHDRDTQQNHCIISAEGFRKDQQDRYAASLLMSILGGPMSSRLFQEIREKNGLCYYIGASHFANFANGTFWIRAGLSKERRAFGIDAINNEIDKIVTDSVTDDELTKALGYMRGQTQMGIETSDALASFVGVQYLHNNQIHTLDRVLQQYEAVTKDDIARVAQGLAKEHRYMYYIK